jgi:hypothetical protein
VAKVLVIVFNTYREAVRARILHGLFALAVFSMLYAVVVGEFASKNALRVVSDVGSFALSTYGVVVAIVMGATTLHRELELKTVFPILARPIWRGQYLFGKYLGTILTLLVFMMANAAVLLLAMHFVAGQGIVVPLCVLLGSTVIAVLVGRKWRDQSTLVMLVWAAALLAAGWLLAKEAPDDRRVVLVSSLLALLEVCIITAIATLFSAFSSPFLTAVFTFGIFLVGRSADTLANLPTKFFGEVVAEAFGFASKVFPNLMVYVPPRTLLTGEAQGVGLSEYVALAAGQTVLWSAGLLICAGFIFRKRDFV